ncbi:MAG: LpqB family beta-propeller domain-containing protein [Kouleothrix sp.]
MRSWPIFAIVALLITGVAIGGWLLGRSAPELTGPAQTIRSGELNVTLRVDQQSIGDRVIEVTVKDPAGQPVEINELRLRFAMSDMNMGISEVVAQQVGSGRFQARGQFFTMAGNWAVDTVIMQTPQSLVLVPFTLAISAPGEASGPLNPLSNDAQTILAGQKLYVANCATCHGASGKGDGPSSTGLNPRPGDFTQHMVPGKHTDGQTFLWIKNGFPNSAMPAWDQRLTDEQIWQLVRYLRTFGQPPGAQANGQTEQPNAQPQVNVPNVQEPLPSIIFTRRGNVWRSDSGTGTLTQLTQLAEGSYPEYPSFSPDGQRIAFVVITPAPVTSTLPLPTSALYVMNADGSAMRPVWQPAEGLLGLFTWAPDGQWLYVAANGVKLGQAGASSDRQLGLVKLDLASGAATPLLADALDPSLSRDGTQLAFLKLSADGYTMSLNIARPDGSGARELIGGKDFQGFYAPRFSPDGKRIIVAAIGGPDTDTQGHPITAATPSLLERTLGLLAPASAEAHGLPWDLWEINADGSGLRRLTRFYEDLPMIAFAPDGTQAAIMGVGGIYRLNPDGTNLRRVDLQGDHGGLDWAR